METNYTGRAGEYLVIAHLLRRDIEAAPVTVDCGIDLEAVKACALATSAGNVPVYEHYRIQVKATRSDTRTLSFPCDRFDEMVETGINLVVVFWRTAGEPLLVVFPPSLLYMMAGADGLWGGDAAATRTTPIYRRGAEMVLKVFVSSSGSSSDRVYVRNRHNEFTAMEQRFDRLEAPDGDWGNVPYEYASWSDEPRTLIHFRDK
jgi:hypothetical protein